MPTSVIPEVRLTARNDRPVRADGDFVLYWMIAARRRRANFALQRAAEIAKQLDRPLFVLEALRCDYRWASDRLHTFVLQGMADNAADFAAANVRYWPYVEPERGAGKGLLEALAARACAIVTDDFPCFFLPRMVAAVAKCVPVRLEAVDGNGLLPMRVGDKVFGRAFDFRRFLQKVLPAHLGEFPVGDPLRGVDGPMADVPRGLATKWPMASPAMLAAEPKALAALPIDHGVPAGDVRGGAVAAGAALRSFFATKLARYGEERSDPDADCASGLSPWLHFGHLSAHQVFAGLAKHEDWSRTRIKATTSGQRGWLGMSDTAEAFVDELVTWRELGYNWCWQRDDYEDFESLPDWAKATLREHAPDPRDALYTLEQFAEGATHDPVWNAAQRQLRETGVLHNYMRMLWGKKVLEWSRSPEEAMAILVELNNRYALDGRNPNSYTGISWVLGRYDRPWAPMRPVYGVIRYMSSANTVKKLKMKGWLARWGDGATAR
ncbi:MAG: deoxyribodipyrimidine photolyase [Planctomycetes bacterium]|nr:deoxyribodipyrimidine photolyase [Planctomycetota bacterium]